MRLLLIRHGNTFETDQVPLQVGKQSDLPLTKRGREQAMECALWITGQELLPSMIYAGQLIRQREFARLIASTVGLQTDRLSYTSALDEIDYGFWEGLTQEEITSRWPQEYADWTETARWPQAIFKGTAEQHLQALKEWLTELSERYPTDATVCAVTSNGILRYFYRLLPEQWEELVRHRHIDRLKVKTGHLCELEISPGKIAIKHWNVKPK